SDIALLAVPETRVRDQHEHRYRRHGGAGDRQRRPHARSGAGCPPDRCLSRWHPGPVGLLAAPDRYLLLGCHWGFHHSVLTHHHSGRFLPAVWDWVERAPNFMLPAALLYVAVKTRRTHPEAPLFAPETPVYVRDPAEIHVH